MTDYKKKKQYLLGIVLDRTLSFSVVYPQIYYMLERLICNLGKEAELIFSITLLGDDVTTLTFSNDSDFTSDREEVLRQLSRIEFRGGNRKGPERITEALNRQLCVLNHFPGASDQENVYQGLLLLSDSLNYDSNDWPAFTSDEPNAYGDYCNHGLRFAYIYTYDSEYMPQFRIVDYKGSLAENNSNTCRYGSLADWLKEEEEAADNFVDDLSEEMMRQYLC